MTPESRRVTSSIIATRATISTLQQALKILEDPDRSEQLAALSEKWRGAARLAADAVYAGARDKVNRAGGVGAWRESERERAEWRRSWNDAEPRQGDGSDAANEADEDGDSGRDASEAGQGRGYLDGVRDDDACASYRSFALDMMLTLLAQGFTIGMMLRSMNIDVNVIGYSEELQTWT